MLHGVSRVIKYPTEIPSGASSTGPHTVQPGERAFCAVHHTELVCMSCFSAAGGKQKSRAKTLAARKNAKRPRPGARGKKKPRKAAAAGRP